MIEESLTEFPSNLPPETIRKLIRLLPYRTHVNGAYEASIRLNGKDYEKGFVLLTPFHMLLARKSFGMLFCIDTLFVLDYKRLITSDDDSGFLLKTNGNNLIIKGEHQLKIAQIMLRNYQIVIGSIENYTALKFSTNCPANFPPIRLDLSPAQQFQLLYYAFCALKQIEVDKLVIYQVYRQFRVSNFCFDLRDFSFTARFVPVAFAASFLPYWTSFFSLKSSTFDPIRSLCFFIEHHNPIKCVCIYNESEEDLLPLAKALSQAPKIPIKCWRIGGCRFTGMSQFISVFVGMQTYIKEIDFGDTEIKSSDLCNLFDAFIRNKYFSKLSYLGLRAAKFSKPSKSSFNKYLQHLASNNPKFLKHLDISKTGIEFPKLLFNIASNEIPIISLVLSDNIFDEWGFEQLMHIITNSKSLSSVDLSRCLFSVDQLSRILRSITPSDGKPPINLILNSIQLSTKDMLSSISALLDNANSRWRGFSFSDANLNLGSARLLLSAFNHMTSITAITLSGCLDHKMVGIGEQVSRLLKLPKLELLDIKGSKTHYLQNEIIPVLTEMKTNNTLRVLDISNNQIGNNNYRDLITLLTANSTLLCVEVDGNSVTDLSLFVTFIKLIINRPQSYWMEFPSNDALLISSSIPRSKQEDFQSSIIKLQQELQMSLILHRNNNNLEFTLNYRNMPTVRQHLVSEGYNIDSKDRMKNRYKHSTILDAFRIEMPFYGLEIPHQKSAIPIGHMSVYETPSLGFIVSETDPPKPIINNTEKKIKKSPSKKSLKTISKQPSKPIVAPVPPKPFIVEYSTDSDDDDFVDRFKPRIQPDESSQIMNKHKSLSDSDSDSAPQVKFK